MITHEWMVKPMHQTEWIEKQGLLVWLAEVFSALGTGLYLIAIFIDNWWGALIGYLIVIFLKLPLHLLYLGRPLRFWRTMPPFSGAWRTSWIARGVVFSVLFSMFGFAQLVTSYFLIQSDMLAGQLHNIVYVVDIILKVIAGIFLLKSAKMARFVTGNIPGLRVPEAVVEELENAPDPLMQGVAIARRLAGVARSCCDGIHIMAMGREDLIPAIVTAVRIKE